METRKLLVLTDVGEEIDDEASLWLLLMHLRENAAVQADIVFVTGDTVSRALRWGALLNSIGREHWSVGRKQLKYFLGPMTPRRVRYPGPNIPAKDLQEVGMQQMYRAFKGGEYDVVLQISPLAGFSTVFSLNTRSSRQVALARVRPRKGSRNPTVIIVGAEGATNFPLDELHVQWKAHLLKSGFTAVHVEKSNYVNWTNDLLQHMPDALVKIVLEDEWNKAVGRIPPWAATLMVRFRVNAQVNYNVVERAYRAFCSQNESSPHFSEAKTWCRQSSEQRRGWVTDGYVRVSRAADDAQGYAAQGNAAIGTIVPMSSCTWESMMSQECARDIESAADERGQKLVLSDLRVDDAMGWAVHLMTEKLLMIFAFHEICAGAAPDLSQVESYFWGTATTSPLEWSEFPSVRGDLSLVQREVVGNPMYDPCGMLMALAVASGDSTQVDKLVRKLSGGEPVSDEKALMGAMKGAMQGMAGSSLSACLLAEASEDG